MKLSHLFEKRSNPELNLKTDRISVLEQYSSREDIFLHFSAINKVGINPKTEFFTPIGIYTYPLKEAWKPYILQNKFPFASTRKFLFILKAKVPVIDLGKDYNMSDWKSDKKTLISKYKSQRFNLSEDTAEWDTFIQYAIRNDLNPDDYPHWDLSIEQLLLIADVASFLKKYPGAKMWGATKLIAMGDGSKDANIAKWNKILRTLGYKALSDRSGKGIIHPNEPIQAIFLEKNSLEIIDVIENK